MKKKSGNLSYIVLGCGVLLSALVLIFMTLTGIKGNLIGTEVSVYGMLSYGDETRIGLVLALIFVIAALAAAGVVLVFKLMNMKCGFDGWLALIGAVLSLVAGILFFCGINLIGPFVKALQNKDVIRFSFLVLNRGSEPEQDE